MRVFLFLLVTWSILTAGSCRRPSDQTEVRFAGTFNALDYGTPALPADYANLPVTGFVIGYSLDDTEPVTRFSNTFGPARLPGAGAEAIICQEGSAFAFAITGSPVTFLMRIIADTGGDDVSDDRDCHCDSKIESITLFNLALFFEGMDIPLQIPELTIRGEVLCPNIPDGHLVSGDREFGGDVMVDGSITLRVEDGRPGLMADVMLHMIEAD